MQTDPMQVVRDVMEGRLGNKPNPKSATASQEEIEDAAAVLQMLETRGGKVLLEKLNKLKEEHVLSPEAYLRTDNVTGLVTVDATMVAAYAGARKTAEDLLQWFKSCNSKVTAAAKQKE